MSDGSGPPSGGRGALSARARVSMKAEARGSDAGLVVVMFFGSALFIASLVVGGGLTTNSPAATQALVSAGGLGGLLISAAGVVGWYRSRRSRNRSELRPAEVTYVDRQVKLSVSAAGSNREIAKLLRTALSARKPLPAPFGRVEGDPADLKSLHPFTDIERETASADLRKAEDDLNDRLWSSAVPLVEPIAQDPDAAAVSRTLPTLPDTE